MATTEPPAGEDLRRRFADDLRAAMKAQDALAVSTLRLAIARMKEADIASRPRAGDGAAAAGLVGDAELVSMLRSMVKQRADSVALFRQGGREELARRELDETAILERYLPAGPDERGLAAAVDAAIAATGAASARDIGRVMAALKQAHGAALDMAQASRAVRARLA